MASKKPPTSDSSAMLGLNLESVESSYRASNLGFLLYGLVRAHVPGLVVELGTYQGYSALHFAAALRDNENIDSRLQLIDLWDRYPYRHSSIEVAQRNFKRNNLLDLPNCEICFSDGDAFQSVSDFANGSIDILHIDVSNTGDKLRQLLELWTPKMSRGPNSLIIAEGGSKERDKVSWMVEHQMSPIQNLLSSQWLAERYSHFCFQPFPSLCVFRYRDDTVA